MQTETLSIPPCRIEGPGIDVERPHTDIRLGVLGTQRRVHGDGTPSASQVEDIAGLGGRQMTQEDRGPQIQTGGREGPRDGLDGDLAAGEIKREFACSDLAARRFAEIVL
ncbi:hypothetical protein GCM10009813_05120 [Brevibacterium marinum]